MKSDSYTPCRLQRALRLVKDPQNFIKLFCAKYDIKTNNHPDYPNLIQFKYGLLGKNLHKHQYLKECRGIILDSANNWNVVAWPFNKFYNYNEPECDPVNMEDRGLVFFEKLDGTCMIVWFYDKKWHVSTLGSITASGNINQNNIDDNKDTFAEYFWKVWQKLNYDGLIESDSDVTFIFEFCTPYNAPVVQTKDDRIILIGARNIDYGFEYFNLRSLTICYYNNWEVNQPVALVDSIFDHIQTLNGFECEGYVMCDRNFNRAKIKAPDYVLKHKMKAYIHEQSFNFTNILELVITKEEQEVVNYWPQYKEAITNVKNGYNDFVFMLNQAYKNADFTSQKAFAESIKKVPLNSILFNIKKRYGNCNEDIIEAYIQFEIQDNKPFLQKLSKAING